MSKILLVEDDKSLREIYGVRLSAEGYEIVTAGDGEEALAIAVKERPDLIISDVMMPKISGFDMLDILRATPEIKDLKVIMMTALSSEDQRQRGESLGADRYLVKSQVGIEDVVRTVHEVLEDTPGAQTSKATEFNNVQAPIERSESSVPLGVDKQPEAPINTTPEQAPTTQTSAEETASASSPTPPEPTVEAAPVAPEPTVTAPPAPEPVEAAPEPAPPAPEPVQAAPEPVRAVSPMPAPEPTIPNPTPQVSTLPPETTQPETTPPAVPVVPEPAVDAAPVAPEPTIPNPTPQVSTLPPETTQPETTPPAAPVVPEPAVETAPVAPEPTPAPATPATPATPESTPIIPEPVQAVSPMPAPEPTIPNPNASTPAGEFPTPTAPFSTDIPKSLKTQLINSVSPSTEADEPATLSEAPAAAPVAPEPTPATPAPATPAPATPESTPIIPEPVQAVSPMPAPEPTSAPEQEKILGTTFQPPQPRDTSDDPDYAKLIDQELNDTSTLPPEQPAQ